MSHPPKPPTQPADPCGARPDIPTNPLWHMGWAAGGNDASFKLLQSSVDWLTCQGKRGKPFDKDSKEFMHDLFEAFATGGNAKGWSEAARLSDHYVNGGGRKIYLHGVLYFSSVIVKDTIAAMKQVIQSKITKTTKTIRLRSFDPDFYRSAAASPLLSRSRSQQTQGALLPGGILLTEQVNQRLKNADNRFALQSETFVSPNGQLSTRWFVISTYDFEPLSVGHVTNIPLGGGRVLKVPDGLSEYLTHPNIAVAAVFDYQSEWIEWWTAAK